MTHETIHSTEKCQNCGVFFNIMEADLTFYKSIEPQIKAEKFSIPQPTFCPACRQQRRLSFRNVRKLYQRTCSLTGEDIVSVYSPDKPYIVYNNKDWSSSSRSGTDFGLDFDFSKPFFEQFNTLFQSVPLPATNINNSYNCTYCNDIGDSSDCLFSFRTHDSKSILYSHRANESQNCVDCYQIKDSRGLYECVQADKCSDSQFLYRCYNISQSSFLRNCENCSDCFMCFNLQDQSYCIFNQKYSPEEYKQKIAEYAKYKHSYLKELFYKNIQNIGLKDQRIVNSLNCSGDELINCINCYDSFMMKGCESARYSWDNIRNVHCMDTYSGGYASFCYEISAVKKGYNNLFCLRTNKCIDSYYNQYIFNCIDCFGCISLKHKQHCILNKQYTKQEYESLLPKIINHMNETGERGEFFPSNISPFGYNETIAQNYFPLDKSEAITQGYKRNDTEDLSQVEDKTKSTHTEVPSISIENISTDITDYNLTCEISGKLFSITKDELSFYKTYSLPLPTEHPEIRHERRTGYKVPRNTKNGTCNKCGISIHSPFDTKTNKVFCNHCYDIVYGGNGLVPEDSFITTV